MNLQMYDGNVHPNEWLKQIQTYCFLKQIKEGRDVEFAKMMIDSTIHIPKNITTLDELVNALQNDISFKIFKHSNKRKLGILKYKGENVGGDTAKFVDTFRKLCRDAEITELEESKKYFIQALPHALKDKFLKESDSINSINDIILRFSNILIEPTFNTNIRNGSIVALRHVATRKYLSTVENLRYTAGGKSQMVFVGSSDINRHALWKIHFGKELATYTDTFIKFETQFNKFLGIRYSESTDRYSEITYTAYKSPSGHTEVSCDLKVDTDWRFDHGNLNHQGYLKSNDVITLSIKSRKHDDRYEFLRSHDFQVTVDDETYQEVMCHDKGIGTNDEWCIELIQEPSSSSKQ